MPNKYVLLFLLMINSICNAQTYIGANIPDACIKKTIVCPISSSPVIDGNLEDWKNDRFYRLDHINSYTNGPGFQDLTNFSMIYSTKYDKDFLYFAFKVEDDHLMSADNFNLIFDADFDSIKNEFSKEGFSCYFFAKGDMSSSNNDILQQFTYSSSFNKKDIWMGELKIPLKVLDIKNGEGEKNINPGDSIQFNIGYEDHDPYVSLTCYGIARSEWGWGGSQVYRWWAVLKFENTEMKNNNKISWQFLKIIY